MRSLIVTFSLAATLAASSAAEAAPIVFDTASTAVLKIDSPLFGGTVTLSAAGPQTFTLDPETPFADVESNFVGIDFPDPMFGAATYNLYNTYTEGSITETLPGSGIYDIVFNLLFELEVTSGLLSGAVFETLDLATFAVQTPTSLPFGGPTAFLDLTPPDAVPIYLQRGDDLGLLAIQGVAEGDVVGMSFDRVVTASPVPEPGTLGLLATGAFGLVGGWYRKRRKVTLAA